MSAVTIQSTCDSRSKVRMALVSLTGGVAYFSTALQLLTLDRRLAALALGAETHDKARVELAKQTELTTRKVGVQMCRLVAHHSNIAHVYTETTVLQKEILKTTEACEQQLHAVEELRLQLYEIECNLVSLFHIEPFRHATSNVSRMHLVRQIMLPSVTLHITWSSLLVANVPLTEISVRSGVPERYVHRPLTSAKVHCSRIVG